MFYVIAAISAGVGLGIWWLATQREKSVAVADRNRKTKAAERARFSQTKSDPPAAEPPRKRPAIRNFGNR
jgi:hypothetical protein